MEYIITKLLRYVVHSRLINADFLMIKKVDHKYWHIDFGKLAHKPWRTITYLGAALKIINSIIKIKTLRWQKHNLPISQSSK